MPTHKHEFIVNAKIVFTTTSDRKRDCYKKYLKESSVRYELKTTRIYLPEK